MIEGVELGARIDMVELLSKTVFEFDIESQRIDVSA
jgi:hypothetical protein